MTLQNRIRYWRQWDGQSAGNVILVRRKLQPKTKHVTIKTFQTIVTSFYCPSYLDPFFPTATSSTFQIDEELLTVYKHCYSSFMFTMRHLQGGVGRLVKYLLSSGIDSITPFNYTRNQICVVILLFLLLFFDPVSYTHLTLPTNREV